MASDVKRSRGRQERGQRKVVASRSKPERPPRPAKPAVETQANRATRPFPVVGMGASAGGLEAFQGFFSRLPPQTGAAFVLVQHLDPHHPSLMPELLARNTSMPVRQVGDETPVEPDHVYVIPPNATLAIEKGVVRVTSPAPSRQPKLPIDLFFRSLAEDQQEWAICILLSGSGTDGTLGLRAVKEHGGMAMAQAPASAKHDSMPRSAIATGLVDYVLAPEEMAAPLVEYVARLAELKDEQRAEATRLEAADQLAKICALLRHKTGHDFSQYKQATLVRRIQRRMLVHHITKVAEYIERLHEDPKEAEQLFKDLLIGVTHFFRDPEAFEALGRRVIPELLERAGNEGSLRVWTPGCATGEEAYSVAMLIHEAMAGLQARPRVQVFAGDIDEEALEAARHALYPEGIANHVSPERLERFFAKRDHSYLVNKDVREMCVFSTHDLIRDPPFSRLDLVVCRNLLIYLEPELQARVAQLFHYALRPGGFLFLGPSENLSGPAELFRTLDKKHRIFQRSGTIVRPSVPFPLLPGRQEPRHAQVRALPPRADETAPVQVLERILVQNYSPAWVVVNARGETVYFSPRTGRYLEPAAGSPSADILTMARKGLRLELRTALHRALRSGETVVRENVQVASDGEVQRVNLIVRPVTELGPQSGFFMVIFQELGPPLGKDQAQAEGPAASATDPLVQQLESELRTTKEHLQATIEELETANEELTSSNEELLSTNEELQSSNEELQTSKEELQSVNEELETINAELKQKVEELDTANSDLKNLFASTQIATLFLDKDFRIKSFTPAASEVFRIIQTDVGRPIADIVPRFVGSDVAADVAAVARTLEMRRCQVRLPDGSAVYLMRILPYRRGDNVVEGLILTFLDVTELSRSQTQQARLAAIVESSQDAIVGRSFDGTITTWNPAAARMFGYTAEEAIGGPISLILPPERRAEVEGVLERVKRGEAVQPFESERISKDGRRFPVSVSMSAIKDGAGNLIGVSASFRDVSELAQARNALQQELRRKDEFLAMLSHELRAPLAPLRTCLDVLRSPAASMDQVSRAKQMMERQAAQLTALVNELLDVSRMSSGKIVLQRRPLDLVELVRTIVEDYRDEAVAQGLSLKTTLPSRPLWVDGDATRLSQAIGNVLHNAVKFTEKGGVEVTLEPERDGSATLAVRDTGVGMDDETLSRLFEPFSQADRSVTRSRGGLGLGLALTKGLVEAHAGTVAARSGGPDRGSELTIRLPLVPRARELPAPIVADDRPTVATRGAPRRRVLIIEDHTDAAESLALVLELAGHDVAIAPDGLAGLERARTFTPEVVLCDIGLPGGIDGYAVAEAFRADPKLSSIQLVALTGYGLEQEHLRALQAGFDVHVTKPVEAQTLQALLANMPPRKEHPPVR